MGTCPVYLVSHPLCQGPVNQVSKGPGVLREEGRHWDTRVMASVGCRGPAPHQVGRAGLVFLTLPLCSGWSQPCCAHPLMRVLLPLPSQPRGSSEVTAHDDMVAPTPPIAPLSSGLRGY